MYDKTENYEIFIFRSLTEKEDEIETRNSSFCYLDNNFYLYKEDSLTLLENGYKDIHKILNKETNHTIKTIEKVFTLIETLEEQVYEREISSEFLDNWFFSKKDLLKVERVLSQTAKVYTDFLKDHKKGGEIKSLGFKDIKEHLERYQRLADSHLKKLDSIYMFYNTLNSEKTNKTLYMLTWISAFFLPLNLLVGFFGMNTEGMVFKDNPDGTYFVLFAIGSFLSTLGLALILQKYKRKNL